MASLTSVHTAHVSGTHDTHDSQTKSCYNPQHHAKLREETSSVEYNCFYYKKDGGHHKAISEEELLWGLLPAGTDGGQPGLHMTLHHGHSIAD